MLDCKIGPVRFFELIADVIKNTWGYVFTYIDDFIIFSTGKNSHTQHIYNVFEALDSFGLTINEKKSICFKNSVKFNGHMVSKEGIRVLPDK